MNFYNLLKSRHLLKDCIATSDFYTNQGIYCGFDPTASSLHLGHMCTLNSLVYASSLGYNPIVILGTATALIGDPSGKTESRQLLEKETVRSNTNSLATQITNIFEKLQKNLGIHNKPLKIIENYSFYQGLGLIDFLRDVGLHFPINPLLHRDFVENREDGITYTEFSYSLLQAFDFYMLYKDHNCIGQVGGSDQWGNITSGTELIRKKLGKHSFGCTLPLLTTKDGKKFGKTEGNALFLDKDRTKSYDIYQYCYNLDDDEIEKLLYRLTFLDPARIQTILSAPSKNRTGQKALAKEIIKTLHGEREAEDVERLSELLFKEDYLKLSIQDIKSLEANANRIFADSKDVETNIVDFLKHKNISSKKDTKRLISAGSVKINGNKCQENSCFKDFTPIQDSVYVLTVGKKNMHLVYLIK